MAKKITAPHSYDPGKGRPKEYLAYLNEREMAYLRSINGNNMERGPRGLPSFPPEDAVGSSSKAGSKGPGGPSGPNSGPSKSTSGGGNLGGGSKGPGGPSGPNSGPSRSSSPGTGGGGKGPGGPSGPNSAPSRSPSSPMGGQGSSFSSPKSAGSYNADRTAQQKAQVSDTRSAVRNTPAARNDLAVGGIRTLSVGPIGTPVNVGPRVAPTQNKTSVAGGWGVAGVGIARRGVPSVVSPSTSGRPGGAAVRDIVAGYSSPSVKQFTDRVPTGKQFGVLGSGYDERIAPSPSPSTSISSQFPSYKYDSPLTPGMTPEDMARRGALMDKYEREIRDIMRGEPVSTGDPRRAGGVPTGNKPSAPTYSGGSFNQENEIQQAAVDRAISAAIAARELGPVQRPSVTRTGSPIDAGGIATLSPRTAPSGFISAAEAGTLPQKTNPLSGAGYGTFNVPRSAQIDAELGRIEKELNAPSMEEERILEIENVPERPTYAAGTWTQSYDVPSKPAVSKKEQQALDMQNQYLGLDERPYAEPSEKTLDRLNEVFRENGLRPSGKTRGIGESEPSMNNEFSGIESSGEILSKDGYGYPTNADGNPITAEDLANMPEDIQKEYFDKVRYSRNYDTPYPLTSAQKEKGRVVGVLDTLKRGIPGLKAGLGALSYVPGQVGEAAEKLSNLRESVNDYDRANPLRKQQIRERAGKGPGVGGGPTSSTSQGGGNPDIGSGGKNEPPRVKPVEKEPAKTPAKTKENGPRPAIYYKWDLGVDIPSPTDSDYTLYLKYLQEKDAAKAGFE